MFIQEKVFQHVICEMAAILSRGDELKSTLTDVQTNLQLGYRTVGQDFTGHEWWCILHK